MAVFSLNSHTICLEKKNLQTFICRLLFNTWLGLTGVCLIVRIKFSLFLTYVVLFCSTKSFFLHKKHSFYAKLTDKIHAVSPITVIT